MFVIDAVRSFLRGQRAGANPWGASTLEWSTSSPPPPFNFIALPVVSSRDPVWSRNEGAPTHVSGLQTSTREGLVTTVLDAIPDVRYEYPAPTIWPLVAAAFIILWLVWSIFSLQGALWGMIPPAIAFIAWFWPRRDETAQGAAVEKRP